MDKENLLKNVLKLNQQRSLKAETRIPDGNSEPSNDSSSSSDSSESDSTSNSEDSYRISKSIHRRAKKYKKSKKISKKHNKQYVGRDQIRNHHLANHRYMRYEVPAQLRHLSRKDMIDRKMYISIEKFRSLKEVDRLWFMSQHIDLVKAFSLDRNNSMYWVGLTSTMDEEVLETVVNLIILQQEADGSKRIIDSVPALNNLSEEQAERAIIGALAPLDLMKCTSVLKAVRVVPEGKEEYFADVLSADLTVYNFNKVMELILGYLKRFESLYKKLLECCPNVEAVPMAYTRGITMGSGMRVGGAIDIMMNNVTNNANQLLVGWYSNLTDDVKKFLRDNKRNPKNISERDSPDEQENLVSRFVRYAHRAMLQYQRAFDQIRTTLRLGQKKWVKDEDRTRGNLKILQKDKTSLNEDNYLDEDGGLVSEHVDDRIFMADNTHRQRDGENNKIFNNNENNNEKQRILFEPKKAGNRHEAAVAMSKLPCFLMNNCPNIKNCKYCHSVEVYEKFMKTMLEYVKTLKSQGPSLKVIEEYFDVDSEGNKLVIDDDIMLNFMTSCMTIVSEQLTPAHIGTELVETDSYGRLRN